MSTLTGSLVPITNSQIHSFSGSSLKPNDQCALKISPNHSNLKLKKSLTVRARSDGGGSGATSIFISGFVLGGLVVGTLGCVYAPKISEALAKTDKKEMLKKLPKFIYDEEKVLEKNRKTLEDRIAQLNAAIESGTFASYSHESPYYDDEKGTYV